MCEVLAASRLLVVLDNCEHLIDMAARVVERLVSRCGGVDVLSTSREGLAAEGEWVLPLRSLGLPEAGDIPETAAAVQFFLNRADAVRGGSEFGAGDLEAVVTICRRLDGIPLAIELAAARTRAMSPADIAARLDQRFDLLTGGRRTAVERHQTLRATLDWSYDMLTDSERRLFERTAVFASRFDLDAVVAVCADGDVPSRWVVGLVDELVAKSMLVAEAEGASRFRLLETLRQYGLEALEERGELDRWRDAHAAYATRFARSLGLDGSGWPRDADIDRAVASLDDLRLARSWLQARGDAAAVAGLLLDLYVLVVVGSIGTEEWIRWCVEALALELEPAARGPLLARLAFGRSHTGENEAAVRDAEAALALGPDPVAYTALVQALMWVAANPRALGRGRVRAPGLPRHHRLRHGVPQAQRLGSSGHGRLVARRHPSRTRFPGGGRAGGGQHAGPVVCAHGCSVGSCHAQPRRGAGSFPGGVTHGQASPGDGRVGNYLAGASCFLEGHRDEAVRYYTAALEPLLSAGLVFEGIVPVLDALALLALPEDPAWAWTIVGHRRRVAARRSTSTSDEARR